MKHPHQFDHERLDVYQLQLKFIEWVTSVLHEVRDNSQGFHREVCDQLDRASLSNLLNTAEGNGKRQGKQRARFFDDARGSAVECAACLDAMVAKKLLCPERIIEGKQMLLRIVSMLCKLVDRFDGTQGTTRDDVSSFDSGTSPAESRPFSALVEDEHENEGRGRETPR